MSKLTAREFLEIVKKECEKHGVKTFFPETPLVKYSEHMPYTSGYFDDTVPVLACGVGKPESEWFEILVHESCHMDQWISKMKLWDDYHEFVITDTFLSGKYVPKGQLKRSFKTAIALELDCEQRSVEKMKSLDLDIDIPRYIKKSNAYLFFYTVLLTTRKWSVVPPYDVPEIIDRMPDHFLDDYTVISEDIMALYKEKCY